MATARKTSYLGKMRLLLLLLVLGTPCAVAQEGKSNLRTWTSSIGTKIEAELLSTTGDEVTLKTKAGRTLKVPLNKLSKADQEFIAAKPSPQEPAKGGVPVNSNLKYEIKGNAVTITDCDEKASGALIIPATIEGKPVSSIGDGAFHDCMSLTDITIPDSVTSIGAKAFCWVCKITNINIPDGVTSIEDLAFRNCTRLTSIVIPDSVTSIGDWAFAYCFELTSITIPDSVTSIGENAFCRVSKLTSIAIPDSVTSIGSNAFEGCGRLTAVTILGDAPKLTNFTPLFGAPIAGRLGATSTIYRKAEAKGWGETFGGRPVKLISEKP